jgi:RNA polymerase sigma-70 factor, ECF subfamily
MNAQRATPFPTHDSSKDSPWRDKSNQEGAPSNAPPSSVAHAANSDDPETTPALEHIYADRARFVWLSLQRFGVARADLEDVCHDVFIVIQARLAEFESGAKLSPWIFGICAKVAANYRRRAYRYLERAEGSMSEDRLQPPTGGVDSPERIVENRQAMAKAEAVLQRLDPMKRAVFVMFELEGLSCLDIAAELEVPVGTVYSRLHAARQLFAQHAKHELAKPGGRDA